MNEFLNPKSMLTPGAAGALMMLLANTLCATFPELAFRYVALALSFLIGLMVLASANLKLAERALYWVVNSLVIFAVGVGTSNIAANVTAPPAAAPRAAESAAVLVALLAPAAHADNAASEARLREDLERLRRENERLRALAQPPAAAAEAAPPPAPAAAEAPRPPPAPAPSGSGEGFFKRW